MASIKERPIVPSVIRDRSSAPSDLEELYEEVRQLRNLVKDLERQEQQHIGDGGCLNKNRRLSNEEHYKK